MTKLNEEQVQQMILAAKEGKSQRIIARDMGVTQATVSRYLTGAVIPSYASKQKRAFYFPDTNEKLCAKCGEKKSVDFFTSTVQPTMAGTYLECWMLFDKFVMRFPTRTLKEYCTEISSQPTL